VQLVLAPGVKAEVAGAPVGGSGVLNFLTGTAVLNPVTGALDISAGGGGPGFATPAIALGTAAAAGAAATVIRSDATIVAFDTTAPVTQAFSDVAAPGAAVVAARRDHVHGMPANPGGASYATPAVVLGTVAAPGVAGTGIRSDSTIVAFDGTVPVTQAFADAAATGAAAVAARRDHVHGMPANPAPAFASPSIALGTAAAAGAAATVIRSDATIVAFDATVPVTQAFSDVAATGAATVAARRDHKHGMPANPGGASYATPAIVLGTVAAPGVASTGIRSDSTIVAFDGTVPVTQAFADAAATGAATVAARRDHVHGMPANPTPAFASPTIALGTAAAAGAAATVIRSDATILAFDVTAPVTQAFSDAAATGAATVAARRDHKHGMPANPAPAFASPSIALGTAAGAGAAATVIRSDATIAAFDATVPVTQAFSDVAATGAAVVAARRDHVHGMPAAPATATTTYVYSYAGSLVAFTSIMPIGPVAAGNIGTVEINVGTAPLGQAVIVDILKNGTSIYNLTPANRPQIAAGGSTGTGGAPDSPAVLTTDRLTVKIAQVGSTLAGAALTVQIPVA
jgi:hypothetical protein